MKVSELIEKPHEIDSPTFNAVMFVIDPSESYTFQATYLSDLLTSEKVLALKETYSSALEVLSELMIAECANYLLKSGYPAERDVCLEWIVYSDKLTRLRTKWNKLWSTIYQPIEEKYESVRIN